MSGARHPKSVECALSSLELFSAPPVQLSIDSQQYVTYLPLVAPNNNTNSPIEFYIPGDDRFIDLTDVLLHLKLKITKPNDETVGDAKVAVINYALNTIFSQVDVTLGDKLISQSNNTHPYRAYLEAILNYSKSSLTSQFTSAIFYADSSHKFSEIDATNAGFVARNALSKASRVFDCIGTIHSDLFNCERLLLNQIDLRIKLLRARNPFCMMYGQDEDYKLHILEASLYVKKVSVSAPVRLGLESALLKHNAIYPVQRIVMKNFSLPEGIKNYNMENLFLGLTPNYVIVTMVEQDGFNGMNEFNALEFKHFDLSEICLVSNGEQVPASAFKPDFEAGHCVREFHHIYLATGRHLRDLPLIMNRDDFMGGYAIFVFPLSPSNEVSCHGAQQNGNVRLKMSFKKGLPRPVTLLTYAAFDSVIEIDARRQVFTDFY